MYFSVVTSKMGNNCGISLFVMLWLPHVGCDNNSPFITVPNIPNLLKRSCNFFIYILIYCSLDGTLINGCRLLEYFFEHDQSLLIMDTHVELLSFNIDYFSPNIHQNYRCHFLLPSDLVTTNRSLSTFFLFLDTYQCVSSNDLSRYCSTHL